MSSFVYERLSQDVRRVVDTAFSAVPAVLKKDGSFEAKDIPSASSNTWISLPNVVCVLADLKGSTKLGVDRYATTSAKLYRSAVEGLVKIFNGFDANFIDIQGDGGFALYWGEKAYERAFCAAMTVRGFSEAWEKRLPDEWKGSPSFPETGFKVGVHSGPTLVKKVGTRKNADEQEAIWAGKAVNYAAKCAQTADRHQVLVTESIWQHFAKNDYVIFSCDCGPIRNEWGQLIVERLPEAENRGYLRSSGWCEQCAGLFVQAIIRGEKWRSISDSDRRLKASTPMERGIARALSGRNNYGSHHSYRRG